MAVTHHELCFGCGQANLFGLQLEAELEGDAALRGRCFLKQDHQGPPGYGHGGIVTAALDEAMALLVHGLGIRALTRRLEVELLAPAPIGAFVHVRATVEERTSDRLRLAAALASETRTVATAQGLFALIR